MKTSQLSLSPIPNNNNKNNQAEMFKSSWYIWPCIDNFWPLYNKYMTQFWFLFIQPFEFRSAQSYFSKQFIRFRVTLLKSISGPGLKSYLCPWNILLKAKDSFRLHGIDISALPSTTSDSLGILIIRLVYVSPNGGNQERRLPLSGLFWYFWSCELRDKSLQG